MSKGLQTEMIRYIIFYDRFNTTGMSCVNYYLFSFDRGNGYENCVSLIKRCHPIIVRIKEDNLLDPNVVTTYMFTNYHF